MNFELIGFFTLLISLFVLICVQVAFTVGAMYLLHSSKPLKDLLIQSAVVILFISLGQPLSYLFFYGSTFLEFVGSFFLLLLLFSAIAGSLVYLKPKIHETHYGDFSFDNFQRPAFNELLSRLATVFLPGAFIIHLLNYLFIGKYMYRYPYTIWLLLIIFESGAIAAGFHFTMKLDRQRFLLFSILNAIFYIAILSLLWNRRILA